MVFAMRYPRAVWVCIAVLTLAAALQLGQLQINIAPQSLLVDDSAEQRFYRDTVAMFGADNVTVVYVRDPDLFSAKRLAAVKATVRALERLPFVDRTHSLFSVPEIRVHDDLVTTAPYLETLPDSAQQANRIKSAALKNPFVRRNLLSDDGTTLAINVYLDSAFYAAEPDADTRIADAIDAAIAPLAGTVAEAWQIGLPYLRGAIAEQAGREQHRLLAAAFAVLLLSLSLLFRRRSALLIPLLTASLSVIWLLGAMAFFGVPLTVLTATVPVLLVIIGSTEDIHLLAEYYATVSGRHGRRAAVRRMARRLGLAVGLTFLTSCLGFAAAGLNPVGLVREFGLVAASGLAINFLLTVFLVPALLGALGETAETCGPNATTKRPRTAARITRSILAHRRLVVAGGVAALGGCAYLAGNLHIDNSLSRYLPVGSGAQQRTLAMQRDLAGIHSFQIVVDGRVDGAFERVRYLAEIRKIQRLVSRHSHFDHSLSFADYVAVLNSAVNDSGEPALPAEDDVVATLTLFVDPGEVRQFVSPDARKASIVVRHGIASSRDLRAELAALERDLQAQLDPDLSARITGHSVLASQAADDLVVGQFRSLSLVLLAIFVVVSLLFRKAAAGLLAAFVAGAPIAALFAVMGMAGIPLDSTTSIIAAVAVGVGVDHTIHLMVRYKRHVDTGISAPDAVVLTVRNEAKPIAAVSLALALGFATLTLSDFLPVYYFGMLSALAVLFGLLATFTLAPALLAGIRLASVWDAPGKGARRIDTDRPRIARAS